MLTRRPNASVVRDDTHGRRPLTTTPVNIVRHTSMPPARAPPSSSSEKPSKFSLDHLFRRMRTKSIEQRGDADKPESGGRDKQTRERSDSGGGDAMRRKFHRTAASIKSSLRPPPLVVSTSSGCGSTTPSRPAAATATLCQSPGGRANVTLAIPVTPPSSVRRHRAETAQHDDDRVKPEHDDNTADVRPRSSFSLGTWHDATVLEAAHDRSSSSSPTTATAAVHQVVRMSSVLPTLRVVSVSRDIVPDVRRLCCVTSSSPSSMKLAKLYVHQLLRVYVFEVRATKWAAYFLQLVRDARRNRTISSADALSVRFAICAYVRREAETRERLKHAQEKLFQHKMTEYRVAMQCICGTSVLKYGRKGKPHVTHLMIENGDTFKWTSAKILSSKKHIAKKSISLAEIVDVRAGPTTDVLAKALEKGTLRLQDAKCTLSLITPKRTFDIKARSTAEREWLLRSFKFLVELAREHQKQVAQQVELSIMKKMETIPVWKHGRKGRPHKTRLFINRYGELSWQGRTGDTILLEDIETVELGHATHVFQRSRKAGLAASRTAQRCFSLVTPTRTLDIETASEQQRDWYVVAIRYLMDKVHEKTAAIKREKAEKQLKMLQELCGGPMDVGCESGNVGISMPPALHA